MTNAIAADETPAHAESMQGDADKNESIVVQAELTPALYEALVSLARQRGISANTVLAQAITTERLFADNVSKGDEVLIKHPDMRTTRILMTDAS